MKKITRSMTTLAAGLGLAGFFALSASLPAFADTTGVAISGGGFTGPTLTVNAFSDYTLGDTSMPTATWAIGAVSDLSGTGAGWGVSLTLTQLLSTTDSKTLPAGSISVTTAPIVSTLDASSLTGITPVSDATVLDTAATTTLAGTAVSLVSAGSGDGMGTYQISSLGVTLAINSHTAFSRVYASTATVSTTETP